MEKGYRSFAEQATSLPPSGSGKLNKAIYYASMQGIAELLLPVEVYDVLYAAGLKAGRPDSKLHREVWHAIESAVRYLTASDTEIGKTKTRRPKPDWNHIVRVAEANGSVSDLAAQSRGGTLRFSEVLDLWFKPEELVSMGGSVETCKTLSVEHWKATGLPMQYFVPNPFRSREGLAKSGKMSERALVSVGPRRIVPVEFDFAPKAGPECGAMLELMQERGYSVQDVNAALHLHLQTLVPLGAAVDSGGKSIHGHYPCAHMADADIQMFMDYALLLGADPQVFILNQPVRFPGGVRSNGKVQKLLYINPEVMNHE